jgi:hypothetical protein
LAACAFPPAGSAVRLKSRFRRYSASCDSAVAAFLEGAAAAFLVLVRFEVLADFFGIRPQSVTHRVAF